MNTAFTFVCFGAIMARYAAQVSLELTNLRHVRAHAGTIPDVFRGSMDAETYGKSVRYTEAKTRFSIVEMTWETVVLCAVLFSGILPWGYEWFRGWVGTGAWGGAIFLLAVGVALSIPGLPLQWYEQFRLEEQFGFNTNTAKTWWTDHFKALVLSFLLGFPILFLILKLFEWLGGTWWLWAWGCVLLFQLVMMLISPILILPLFNKLTPLPEGSLRDRLFQLATRTGFLARDIQVMDGSKRSRHSNAFFTGLGNFRKIVLFDTLVEQLDESELEAVLAHEIGHYKRRHILKFLLWSAFSTLVGFFILSLLMKQPAFYQSFGFAPDNPAPALLLFTMLAGVFLFWFTPLGNMWSRKHEYEADAYAVECIGKNEPMITALRKLNEKNLSNLTPHPIYSRFYYSHPTLQERENALQQKQLPQN